MTPANYFLGSRHFFGYLLSGALWLSGILLATGYNPRGLAGWYYVTAFFLTSYVLGYCVHAPLFRWLLHLDDLRHRPKTKPWDVEKTDAPKHDEAKTNVNADSELTVALHRRHTTVFGIIQSQMKAMPGLEIYHSTWSVDEKEKYCKRYVVEFSEHLRKDVEEHESSINFIVAVIHGLVPVAIGIQIYLSFHISPPKTILALVLYFFLILVALSLFTKALPFKRRIEREFWLDAFLLLVANQEKVNRNDRQPADVK